MTTSARVAVVGLSCRLPGGIDTPEKLWQVLRSGANLCGEVPKDRWNAERFFAHGDQAPGKAYVRRGHFMDWDFSLFDAGFFGISPREAEYLDPQQRLLLELTWEAFENAGIDATALAGSKTGVYVGGFTLDHLLNQLGSSGRSAIGPHSAAGSTLTMLANRVSYAFDLRGPSFALDTACSSSLVAFAYACHDIAAGRCDLAVAGGSSVMLRPEYAIAMSKGHFLAKDGRSKSFDSRADGYGRGEGGVVVVLKRLERAIEDGDNVLAVVEAAGVNQDGRTPGITVPSGDAQETLMREVLTGAAVDPRRVLYVEAHGTGTPIGDPIETHAIANVYGSGRSTPVRVGSLKSNIGHLEAAAGIAGVLKSVLVLRHNWVPPVAALERLNPALPGADRGVEIARAGSELAADAADRRVAINSFGYGGTNAHVVLAHPAAHAVGQAPPAPSDGGGDDEAAPSEGWLLPLSARHPAALRERAAGLMARLADSSVPIGDVLHTAALRRPHLSHRLLVRGDSRESLRAELHRFVLKNEVENGATGVQPFTGDPRPVFVFTGMGPQWWGMGQTLYRESAVYRAAVEEADAIFVRHSGGRSILAEMLKDEDSSRITATEIAQPANFLLQLGVATMLGHEGVVPGAVVGHSVGEVSSAWASGMLSLEDALLVSFHRSRIQKKAAGAGAMLAVGLPEADVVPLIAGDVGRISVAAVNSPKGVTLAGEEACLDRLAAELTGRGIFARKLTVEVPYHSPMMEPLKPELREALASLRPREPSIELHSSVSGGKADRPFDAEYWCDNVREPVRFQAAVEALIAAGFTAFVEIGPHPVLRSSLAEIFARAEGELRSVRTLHRNEPEVASLRRATAEIYAGGCDLDWRRLYPEGRLVDLPNYAWQRQPHWQEAPHQREDRLAARVRPLLTMRQSGDGWRTDLGDFRLAYFKDHVVGGTAIMPAAGYLETLLEAQAAASREDSSGWCLRDVEIEKPLMLDDDRAVNLEVRVSGGGDAVELWSHRDSEAEAAVRHMRGRFHPLQVGPEHAGVEAFERWRILPEELNVRALYERFSGFALSYGPLFQPITELKRDRAQRCAFARLELPADLEAECQGYLAHPVMLDGCFQTVLSLIEPGDGAFLPTAIEAIELHRPIPRVAWCWSKLRQQDKRTIVCDLQLIEADGTTVARIRGLTCTSLTGGRRRVEMPGGDYAYRWRLQEAVSGGTGHRRLLVLAEREDGLPAALRASLLAAGANVQLRTVAAVGERLLDGPDASESFDAVVFIARAHLSRGDDPIGEREAARLLAIMQGLGGIASETAPRLYVVTHDAVATGADAQVDPAQGTLIGLVRAGFNELGALRCTTVDVPSLVEETLIDQLAAELTIDAVEDEVALRPSGRWVAELAATGAFLEPATVDVRLASGRQVVVRPGESGSLVASLRQPPQLAAHDVEVTLERALLDGESLARFCRGDDPANACQGLVGRIERVGREVTAGLQPGVRVAALAPIGLDSAVVLDTRLHPMVALDALAAAGGDDDGDDDLLLPLRGIVHRLADLAAVPAGANALVVGTVLGAALARELEARGVRVSTMPANADRWSLGDLEKARADVGDFEVIAAPLEAWARVFGADGLAEGGCLIELATSRKPFRCHPRVGRLVRLDPFSRSDRRSLVEAMRAVEHRSVVATLGVPRAEVGIADLLAAAGADLEEHALIAVRYAPDAAAVLREVQIDAPLIDAKGSYLVTGGFGGLGREIALWLARCGAGRIVIASRRGAEGDDERGFLAELKRLGSKAVAVRCDVSIAEQIGPLVAAADQEALPLRGVFHTAGVLDDKPLATMIPPELSKVLRAKASSAWLLHEATKGSALHHFVLYSSVSALVGNSGQGNYCAANGFLDALAHHRRGLGLPALSVNWGAIQSVGMLGQDERVEQHLRRIGLAPLASGVALAGLERALTKNLTQVAIAAAIDWDQWARYETFGGRSPRFKSLVAAARIDKANDPAGRLAAKLRPLGAEDRAEVAAALVIEIFARTLKVPGEQIGPTQPLESLGIDSLMATEIQLDVEAKLGVSFGALELIGEATIQKLAGSVLDRLGIADEAMPLAAE